jgi:hypothetical protein
MSKEKKLKEKSSPIKEKLVGKMLNAPNAEEKFGIILPLLIKQSKPDL